MLLSRLIVLGLALAVSSGNDASSALVWSNGGQLSEAGHALLQELDSAERRGLRSADYDTRRLHSLIDANRWPDADRALTAAAMRFSSDLMHGRVLPAQVGYELDNPQPRIDAAAAAASLARSQDVSATLDSFEPQLRHYALLKKALWNYQALALRPELTRLPPLPTRSVRPGEPYSGMPELRRLLVAQGDLLQGQLAVSSVLDRDIAQALQRFQTRVGIESDGVLGKATWNALTTPFARRVEQIELTLERMRWLPRTLNVPPIIVNIPQFKLFAFRTPRDYAQELLQMNVIVGATFQGRQTPVFAAEMRYVVLNPYWDIPFGIMKREYLAEIEADADWPARNGYEIVKGQGDAAPAVPVTDANIRLLASGKLRLRQVPGPNNALGRVKFMFPNRHNVYLHDTPGRRLFSATRRVFSHGCIRVADPMALLLHVLRNDPSWTRERIEQALSGSKATRITLSQPIPVFILYGTALATEAGDTLFFEDVYAQDAKLARLLAGY